MTTLYIDMDGVVADFNKYAKEILNTDRTTHSWPPSDWIQIRANLRLYRDLDKTPEADKLIELCTKFSKIKKINMFFLTAVPRDDDVPFAFYDKVMWAQKHYPSIPVLFGPHSKDKHKHCKPNDILIDDRPSNCREWRAAGGIAIQHLGDIEKTASSLLELL